MTIYSSRSSLNRLYKTKTTSRPLPRRERRSHCRSSNVGQLTIEVDWMKKNLWNCETDSRRVEFVEPHHDPIGSN
jgi:hypothetical protein